MTLPQKTTIHRHLREFLRESFLPPRNTGTPADGTAPRRIISVDLAKGLCILLVVLYHLNSQVFGLPNFDALRMPLYFVLSGLFFKPYGDIAAFTVRKINNILIPFLFWMLVSYLCMLAYRYTLRHQIAPLNNLWVGFSTHNIYLNRPLWFMLCLFLTHHLFYLLHRTLPAAARLAGVLLLALVGNAVSAAGYYLPLWLDSACTAMPLFYMGYLLKQSSLLERRSRWTHTLSAGLLSIAAAYLLYYHFDAPTCSFRTNEIKGSIPILYLDSCLFVLGVLLLCKTIRWLPLLSYWGRYSLIILCVHPLYIRYLPTLCKHNGITLSATSLRLLILLLCWLSLPLFKTLLPRFTAQKPLLRIPRRTTPASAPAADPRTP